MFGIAPMTGDNHTSFNDEQPIKKSDGDDIVVTFVKGSMLRYVSPAQFSRNRLSISTTLHKPDKLTCFRF